MPASQVSEITRGLDEQVDAFRNRVLEAEYPAMGVDALYQKIRSDSRVGEKAGGRTIHQIANPEMNFHQLRVMI
jgi:transposase-like protein